MVLSYLSRGGLTSKNVYLNGFYSVADVNIGLHRAALRCTMPHPHSCGVSPFYLP